MEEIFSLEKKAGVLCKRKCKATKKKTQSFVDSCRKKLLK